MSLTTDPNDPRLGHGVDTEPIPQHEVYLVLSDEERAKGFIRPLHRAYVHVGVESTYKNPISELTPMEKHRHPGANYVAYVDYDESEKQHSSIVGRYFTQEQLDHHIKKGCGTRTTMGLALCETYARDPKFYGATYCCGCQKHLPVSEFVWDGTNDRVGS